MLCYMKFYYTIFGKRARYAIFVKNRFFIVCIERFCGERWYKRNFLCKFVRLFDGMCFYFRLKDKKTYFGLNIIDILAQRAMPAKAFYMNSRGLLSLREHNLKTRRL